MRPLLLILILAGAAVAQAPANSIAIFEGYSRTSGFGLNAGEDWPSRLMALPWAANSSVTKVVCAVSGSKVSDMIARYNTCVHPQRPAVTGKNVFLFANDIFINDIHEGYSSEDIMSNAETLWALAKADGIKVIGGTSMPNHNDEVVLKVNLQKVNQMARQSLTWNYFVDMEKVQPNAGDITLFSDGLHGNAAQQRLEARAVNSEMMGESLLTAGAYQQAIDGTMQAASLGIGGEAIEGIPFHVRKSVGEVARYETTGDHAGWSTVLNYDTGSSMLFGIENSEGGHIFTGTAPYAGVVGPGASGASLDFGAAGAVRMRITPAGNAGLTGNGNGYMLKSPNGSVCRMLTIDNLGLLVLSNCP